MHGRPAAETIYLAINNSTRRPMSRRLILAHMTGIHSANSVSMHTANTEHVSLTTSMHSCLSRERLTECDTICVQQIDVLVL